MAQPDLQLTIKNPLRAKAQDKPYWAPVGDISLWRDQKGVWSGKCRIFAFGFEFSVFEKTEFVEEKPAARGKPAYRGESTDPQQDKVPF